VSDVFVPKPAVPTSVSTPLLDSSEGITGFPVGPKSTSANTMYGGTASLDALVSLTSIDNKECFLYYEPFSMLKN
jgi:hypothetical protein